MIILIPMAGLATRFLHEGITTPKPLILADGKPLIQHALETLGLTGRFVFITRRYDEPEDNEALSALLHGLCPRSLEITLDTPTHGAVETCLKARDIIDTDEPLVITNCDQRTEWDAEAFMAVIELYDPDGLVVTHESSDPKHSYAGVSSAGEVLRVVEKQVISWDALIGVHYWKHGRLFVESADALLKARDVGDQRECYVSETYNHLITSGRRVIAHRVGPNEYIPLGTPYDVAIYEAKLKEYRTSKPKTLFIDLDGTILRHLHRFSDVESTPPLLLDGVLAKMNEWDSHGHRIVLCTARKESARAMTEQQLRDLGLCWDQLLMGLTSGGRVLINDKLSSGQPDRATAINVVTNQGFEDVDWAALGL